MSGSPTFARRKKNRNGGILRLRLAYDRRRKNLYRITISLPASGKKFSETVASLFAGKECFSMQQQSSLSICLQCKIFFKGHMKRNKKKAVL